MTHGIARTALLTGLLTATLTGAVAFPAAAGSVGGIVIAPPVGRGVWEGRIRIIHHYYDGQPNYTTYQSASGSTQAQCNAALTAAFSAAVAAESTAQVEYDIYCTWHP